MFLVSEGFQSRNVLTFVLIARKTLLTFKDKNYS